MKAEDEWSALTSKVAGLEQGYKRTACILALCPLSELADSSISLNPFCKVVLENGEAHSVIGSLDLNQGCQLPGELSGDYPEVHFAHISCQHSQTRTSCSNSHF
jgi:hypothetical protein